MTQDTMNMVLTRTIDASPELVWRAWSDETLVKQWWGPTGFTAPVVNINFNEGETTMVCMRTPDGHDLYNTWHYTEIVPLEKIAFVQRFSDKDGNALNPAAMGMPPGIPAEVPHVIEFKAAGSGATELTITEYGYTSAEVVDLSKAGMAQCLDKIEECLKHIN